MHTQIVKGIIGNKLGTGGAYTAEELIKNKKMAFDDITDLITLLIPKQAI
ncbi:Uncharacterised protein [Legionella beliardensis]|uniref:Uncharacterized protein n=1 Tax=Legionella beliardensis TaxID=91822 RepID=A0A378I4P0_9GAMM|nr:hypothetical protein [Legionella beliardensis]STX30177.1 Uncharacterised protein [Legionella beliardensis]